MSPNPIAVSNQGNAKRENEFGAKPKTPQDQQQIA